MPRKKRQPDPAVEEVTALTPAPAESSPPPAEGGAEEPKRQWAAGPNWFNAVSLSDERDGPRARLGRDNKFGQMTMAFDEKPEGEVIDALHAAGWAWRGKEKYWTKQLDREHRTAGQQDAEWFFEELTDGMRARRGLGDSPAVG